MKPKQILTIVLIVVAGVYFAMNTSTNPNQVTITGEITNPKGDTIKIILKDTTYIATLSKSANFSISFTLDSATYLSFYHGEEVSTMHLNGGENVHLTINTDLFDETIKYTGSTESSYLAKKYLLTEDADIYSQLYTTEKDELLNNLNAHIDEIKLELVKINNVAFNTAEEEEFEKMISYYSKTADAISKLPKTGEPAINFTYPDKDGNEFSLTSFKGNLVYVDVWATWCGPCKEEIPSLQQLEADYHGKNITFMSISVDTDKEAWEKMVAEKELGGVQLWANGFSGVEGSITKDYHIFSIPRFMLFDAAGNVISTKAPRPSSEDIRESLDANL